LANPRQREATWTIKLSGELVVANGRELESSGDLDGAWNRYQAALRFVSQMRPFQTNYQFHRVNEVEHLVLGQLSRWVGRKDQTIQRLRAAAD